jgi:uncharacterized protein YjbI with pentapeptide repeats
MNLSWPRLLISGITLCALIVLVFSLFGPALAWLAQPTLSGLDPKDKAAALSNIRSQATVAVGVLGSVLVALVAVPKYFTEKDKQVTDRFSVAIDHVGSSNPTVREGGVWVLNRIMDDSPRDRIGAQNVLARLVRELSPRIVSPAKAATGAQELPGDIAAAVTIASTKRKHARGIPTAPLDFRNSHLAAVDLRDAQLDHARFTGTNLTRADLARSVLSGADFTNSVLTGATLARATCREAVFTDAILQRADLTGTDLTGANLAGADLAGATLDGTILTGANLRAVHLEGADLSRCRGLTENQLNGTLVDDSTQLPLNMTHPDGGAALL